MVHNAITVDLNIVLKQNSTINDIARQIQKKCRNRLICTLNDGSIIYFNKKSEFPRFLVYKGKDRSSYLFEDEDSKIYRVFGIDAARLIYPCIDQEEPSIHSNSDPSCLDNNAKVCGNVYDSVYNKMKSPYTQHEAEKKS